MSLVLYYAPGSAAAIPHVVLEEAGLSYALKRLDPRTETDKPVGELSLYPSERITALSDNDFAIFETGAVLLHLLRKPAAAWLMPEEGTNQHSKFLQWLFYLETTPRPAISEYLYPDRWVHDADEQAYLRQKASGRLSQQFGFLDAHVSEGSFLPHGFSALDIYLTVLARWSADLETPMWKWPRLAKIIDTTRQRPAFLRMISQQEIEWPQIDGGLTGQKSRHRLFW